MRPMKVLVVDDMELDRTLLNEVLTDAYPDDLQIDEAAGGVAALEYLAERTPDLVFLDVRMPGIDGFQVLEELRARRPATWPVVVMWTSSSHPDDVRRAYEHHANLYVQKPDSLADLDAAARQCIDTVGLVARP